MSNQAQSVFRKYPNQTQFVEHKQQIWCGGDLIHVIHTPGHSKSCQSFYHQPYVFQETVYLQIE